jgi:hypothetical protein
VNSANSVPYLRLETFVEMSTSREIAAAVDVLDEIGEFRKK